MAGAGRGFAHFLFRIVESHDARADRGQPGRRHHEVSPYSELKRCAISRASSRCCDLIVADRHDRGLIQQNVGCHQHGVLQQAVADGLLRRGLGLVLRHALEPADRRDAGQHPGQFGVRGTVDCTMIAESSVDADREEHSGQFFDLRRSSAGSW